MQAIFGKKRSKKPSAGRSVSGGESGKEECEPKSPENHRSTKDFVPGNLNSITLHFGNLEAKENESNKFSNRNSTPSSKNESFQEKKPMTNMTSIDEVSDCKSKEVSDQRREKQKKSHEFPGRSIGNFLHKKTQEIPDVNFKKSHEINMSKNESFKCAVERLAVETEKRTSSDLRPRDTEMSLFNEIDLVESQSGDFKKRSKTLLKCAPLRRRRSSKKRPIQSQNENKNEGFWSIKSFFNKARFLNFFLEKNDGYSKRSNFVGLNMTEKGEIKPKILVERFIKQKVPLEEDLEIKKYFRDFWFYIIYLLLITAVAMCMVTSGMYYFTTLTSSMFMDSKIGKTPDPAGPGTPPLKFEYEKTLRTIHTIEDFWEFAETTLLDLLYWNFFSFGMDATHTEEDDKKMFYENQVLGVPRLRQVRVRNDSCKIHSAVRRYFDSCYSYYSPFAEETRPIRVDMEYSATSTAWVYTDAEDLKMTSYWGEISVYGGGGYYLDLDMTKENSKAMIKELKDNFWLSRATRAVFIDFNLYNANVNLFCLCKILLEFSPVGGVIPKSDFLSLKLIRYLSPFDFFILGCEFILVLYLFYFNWELLKKVLRQKRAFFLSFWNYLDMTMVLLLAVYVILSIIRYTSTDNLIHVITERPYEYTEFNFVKEIQVNFNNVIAALLFASWVKLITFLTFNITMLEFRKTLQMSIRNIMGFLPMLTIMFFSFALLGNLLFGSEVKNCRTIWFSLLFLLQALMGEFHYNKIQESHRILGPMFYLAFIFFMFFVFMNVFIAIISNAYSQVKSEVILVRPKVWQYTKTGVMNLMTCCRLRKKLKKGISLKKEIIFNEIFTALKKSGFSEDEIRIFFLKYEINVENILDDNTRRKIMDDLELKRLDFDTNTRDSEFKFLRRRINNLNSRMDEVETNLQPVIDKVDVLLDRSKSKKYS